MKTVTLFFILVCGVACLEQLSIPLVKRSVMTGTEYEQDCFYTFDLTLKSETSQIVQAVIDLQSTNNWIIDQSCTNCFNSSSKKLGAFSCRNPCGKEVLDDPAILLFGSKIKANRHINVDVTGSLSGISIIANQAIDVTELKDNNLLQQQHLFLDQVTAGISFSADSKNNAQSVLSQIFKTGQIPYLQFSLFFNSQMGRDGVKLKIVQDENDKTFSWTVKIGPFFQIANAPPLSTQVVERPDEKHTSGLFNVQLDSTTKYVIVPLVAWNRLSKTLFSHNDCVVDSLKNRLCNCPGGSSSWVPIQFDLVLDPSQADLEKNTHRFSFEPSSFLEYITTGPNAGKCLLLIKPREGDALIEYVFGTSFLQNFYSIFSFESKSITLSQTHGFVPSTLHIDPAYRLYFIISGSIIGVILIGIILSLLKPVSLSSNEEREALGEKSRQPPISTSVSYLVRSPREIESMQQITNSVKAQPMMSAPIHARIINSPYLSNVSYASQQINPYQ